ncbi:receptor-type tyrosine-protein phosphatase H isoform X2 [Spea bombifrons]|uniref:receptor-type tyrosine-protein phosphatase H isoform X2 n=1 Tax=Spea bombifrons TaxID=233779 RepID=UPI00234B6A90|nr:receptor-type tyrosine-protein phosphatase H isoform X2 [Spea bombifrons]
MAFFIITFKQCKLLVLLSLTLLVWHGGQGTAAQSVSQVTQFKVTRTTNSSATLSWDAPSDAGNYTYNITVLSDTGTTEERTTDKSPFVVEGLTAGINYEFTITTNSSGNFSSPVSTNGTTEPNIVSDFIVKGRTTSTVLLSWRAPSDQNKGSYKYKISVSPGEERIINTGENANITDLKPGDNYTFTITTMTQNNVSSTGNPSTQTTTIPSAVKNLTVINRTTTTVDLSWNVPNDTNTATYSYIISVTGGISPSNFTTSVNSQKVENLHPGVNYTFTVYTKTVNDVFSASQSVEETTIPSAVNNVTVINRTTTTVDLSWNVPNDTNTATYSYIISVINGTSFFNVTTSQSVNSQKVGNLEPGVTYKFTVYTKTVNNVLSSASQPVEGTTIPSAVNNVTVMNRTTTTVDLSWNVPNNTNTATYSYVISVINGTSFFNVTTKQSVNSRKVEELLPGVNYTFTVYTKTVNDVFSASQSVEGTTIPSAVTDIVLVSRTNSSITIKWTPPNDVRVSLYKYKLITTNQPEGMITTFNSNFTANALAPGSRYTFEVRSEIDNLNSKSAAFTVYSVPNQPVNVSGNPVNTSSVDVTWEAPNDPNKDYYQYKVTWSEEDGSSKNTQTTNKTNISIQNLNAGHTYYVTVSSVISDTFSAMAQKWLQTNPLSPTELTISNITSTSVLFKWTRPSASNSVLSGFQIKASFPGVTPKVVNLSDSSLNEFELKGLIPGNLYDFELRSYTVSKIMATSSRIQRREVSSTPEITTYSDPISKTERMFPDPVSAFSCSKVSGGYALKVDITCPKGFFSEIQLLVNDKLRNQITNCTSSETVQVTSLQPAVGYKIQIKTLADVRATESDIITCNTDNVGVIVGAVVGVLLFLLLVGLIAFFILKKRRTKSPETPIAFDTGHNRYHSISKERFPTYYQMQHADSDFGFAEAYQELASAGIKQSKNAADLPDNKVKNRFTNVLPYDHSRVKLSCIDDNPCTDYINANYMPGYNSTKEFIATQGPLDNTTADFWRMIWEHHVSTIVMLTNCVENGRVKCEHYWPLDYTPCTYGDITVTVSSETILPEWTIRDFSLKHAHQDGINYVRHFHFTAWPDHGVPENTSTIIQFRDLVREYMDQRRSKGPTVVHCSAGVGRTGTLIALDYLIQQMEREQRIGVYGFVEKMRINRPLMVQTESQYVFLNKCMLSLIQEPIEENIYENQITDLIYENANVVRNFQRENA